MRVYTRALKRAGLSHAAAVKLNRRLNEPDFEVVTSSLFREVKAKSDTTRYQLRILGEFFNPKQRKTSFQNGYSHAYLKIDNKMVEEAVNDARYKLGGTNWELRWIIEREMTEYVLTGEDAAEAVLNETPDGGGTFGGRDSDDDEEFDE